MKKQLQELLICPRCLPLEHSLGCTVHQTNGRDILSGYLECRNCGRRYPIEEGIAHLLPDGRVPAAQARYETDALVSAYLWSHYAYIAGDPDASNAYLSWAEQLNRDVPLGLDIGCAVGRFTFEMSTRSELTVGVDLSVELIRWARQLMRDRCVVFSVIDEGELTERREICLPEYWRPEQVEFILADSLALPFPGATFSSIASLNVLDKVSRPLIHLTEANRVALRRNAWFLLADPFSWSEDYAPASEWLGGKERGSFTGKGLNNVINLLKGKKRIIRPGWNFIRQGDVWWKIRNHSNHFELIRSLFALVCR